MGISTGENPERSSVLVGEINASIQGVHCLVGVAGDLGLGFLQRLVASSASFVIFRLSCCEKFYGEAHVKIV